VSHRVHLRLTVVAVLAIACADHTGPNAPPRPSLDVTPFNGPVILAAGDIADCNKLGDEATAAVLDAELAMNPGAIVVPLGDLAYPAGSTSDFQNCYGPSWGRFRNQTRPVIGNKEYDSSPTAEPYRAFFGDRAGPAGRYYYSYDIGSWHVVVLNMNSTFVSTKAGSAQDNWLVADLQANTKPCVLALWHQPRYYSASSPATTLPLPPGYTLTPWQRLYAARADVSLHGHHHVYERFRPLRPDGQPDDSLGMRQLIVGAGGSSGGTLAVQHPMSEVYHSNTRGVLRLELGERSYRAIFRPVAGKTFTDTVTATCHKAPALVPPPDSTPLPPADSGPPPPDTSTPPPIDTTTPPVDSTPPPPPPGPAIHLTVTGRKDATKQYMTLDWTGATGASVDVYRNKVFLNLQANDGHYVNSRSLPGSPSYVYKVCEQGTAICSSEVTVTF
jgi:hypothetical protein